jgi:hypothetical protein
MPLALVNDRVSAVALKPPVMLTVALVIFAPSG